MDYSIVRKFTVSATSQGFYGEKCTIETEFTGQIISMQAKNRKTHHVTNDWINNTRCPSCAHFVPNKIVLVCVLVFDYDLHFDLLSDVNIG